MENNCQLHLALLPDDPFSDSQQAGLKTLKHVTDGWTYRQTNRRTGGLLELLLGMINEEDLKDD